MKKRFFAVLLVLAMVAAFTGCGSSSSAPAETPAAMPEVTEEVETTTEPEAEVEEPAESVEPAYMPVTTAADMTVTADAFDIYNANGLYIRFDSLGYREDRPTHYPRADFTVSNHTGKSVILFFHNIVINGYVDAGSSFMRYDEDGEFNPYISLNDMVYLGYDKIESISGIINIQTVNKETNIIENELGDISFEINTSAYTGENSLPTVTNAFVAYEDKDITVYGYTPELYSSSGTKGINTVLIATGSGEKTLDFPLRFSYFNDVDTCTLNGERCALAYSYDYILTDQSHYAVMHFTADSMIFNAGAIKDLESQADIHSWGIKLDVFDAFSGNYGGSVNYLYNAE